MSRHDRDHARRGAGDDGFASVFTALVLVAALAFAALVVDGGRAYYQSRMMQNAADAAALAGARALDRDVLFRDDDPVTGQPAAPDYGAVRAAINELLAENGASTLDQDPPSSCRLVNAAGVAVTDNCSAGAVQQAAADRAGAADGGAVSGVLVEAAGRQTTFLGEFAGQAQVTARATAVATIQPFLGGTGAPFILCGKFTPENAGDVYPILRSDNTVDFDAVKLNGWETRYDDDGDPFDDPNQTKIPIQRGNQQKACGGASGTFKGLNGSDSVNLANTCLSIATPVNCDWAEVTPGNGHRAEIRVVVSGARPCTTADVEAQTYDCDLLVPVADSSIANGNNMRLHLVAWISVHVTPAEKESCSPDQNGKQGDVFCATINVETSWALVSGGVTSSGTVRDRLTTRAIKLFR